VKFEPEVTVPGASSAMSSAVRASGSASSCCAVMTVRESTLLTSIGGKALAVTCTPCRLVAPAAAPVPAKST